MKPSVADDDLDLANLDLDMDDLAKLNQMFPMDSFDDENEDELAEALRGIESGDFNIDEFFKDGAESLLEELGDVGADLPDDDVDGDDLLGELLAAADSSTSSMIGIGTTSSSSGSTTATGRGRGKKPKVVSEGGNDGDGVGEGEAGLPLPPGVSGDLLLGSLQLDIADGDVVPRTASSGGSGSSTPLPPLEEFKRLMASLGPESMLDDDLLFGLDDDPEIDEEMVLSGKQFRDTEQRDNVVVELRETEDGEQLFYDGVQYNGPELPMGSLTPRVDPDEEDPYYDVYAPNIYDGGKARSNFERYNVDNATITEAREFNQYLYATEPDEAVNSRVRIISVITNSTQNSTALEMVNSIYDYIRAGTTDVANNIDFEIHCYKYYEEDEVSQYLLRYSLSPLSIYITHTHTLTLALLTTKQPVEELRDMIQMWLESYNTYHLVDGSAMKEAWGGIMPNILLSEKNLRAILDQVKWAMHEDSMDGALLSPRMRRIRFRGGAQEMITGYNTEDLEAEFSVVSVR